MHGDFIQSMGSCWGADYTHFIVELQVILYELICEVISV